MYMLNTDFTAFMTFVTQSAKNYVMTIVLIFIVYFLGMVMLQTLTTNILSIIIAIKSSQKDIDLIKNSK